MHIFDKLFRLEVKKEGLPDSIMNKRYADDVNMVVKNVPREGGAHQQGAEEPTMKDDAYTAKVYTQIANRVMPR